MIIDCISDLHGTFPQLDGGDLLLIAGDMTARNQIYEWNNFYQWLARQKYDKKIMIAGNHDNFLTQCIPSEEARKEIGITEDGFEYLCDSGTEFQGLKVWGSPWSLWFKGINPHCRAFTGAESDLKKYYDLIPDDIDILITHSPPFGMLDGIPMEDGSEYHVGSKSLADKLEKMPNLKLHVFGHIHEAYGQSYQGYYADCINDPNPVPCGHLSVNASLMNEKYKFVNKPVRVIL